MTWQVMDRSPTRIHDEPMTTTTTNPTTTANTSSKNTSTQNSSTSTPADPRPTPILRRVFWVDRVVALTSGVVLIAASSVFGNVLDWPMAVVAALGAALLPYGAFLHWIVAGTRHESAFAKLTLGADVAWVAASTVVFATLSSDASAIAPWLVAGQALVIADIAIAKTVGFMRGRR